MPSPRNVLLLLSLPLRQSGPADHLTSIWTHSSAPSPTSKYRSDLAALPPPVPSATVPLRRLQHGGQCAGAAGPLAPCLRRCCRTRAAPPGPALAAAASPAYARSRLRRCTCACCNLPGLLAPSAGAGAQGLGNRTEQDKQGTEERRLASLASAFVSYSRNIDNRRNAFNSSECKQSNAKIH
jgi:hypothetical protein